MTPLNGILPVRLSWLLMKFNEIRNENVKVPKGPTVDRSKSLRFQTKEYNPAFWNDYDQVSLFPLTTKQLEDLEHRMPLEEQFEITTGMER